MYSKIVIPIKGESYIEKTDKHISIPTGYEMSAGNIGISHPDCRLRVVICCDNYNDIINNIPLHAEIYMEEEYPRDKYFAVPKNIAENIVESINKRKYKLWNVSPNKN